MTRQGGLGHRLWKAFVIQAGLIAVAAILGIYAARFVLSDVLISSALNSEAEHFWGRYADNNDFPRPDTYNMKGHLAGRDAVPEKIRNLQEGIHKLSGDSVDVYIIHVSERHGRKLYLEFDGESVGELALLFGTIPLAGVLIVIYLTTWFLYRFSRRAVSPLIQLSKQVDKLDPKNTEHFAINLSDISGDADQEVMNLSRALTNLLRRI
ncbi:MAG TPA: sensor histidine kinase, partial [Gammaproteobacteria bacterium]